jgi:hypothetical protein
MVLAAILKPHQCLRSIRSLSSVVNQADKVTTKNDLKPFCEIPGPKGIPFLGKVERSGGNLTG